MPGHQTQGPLEGKQNRVGKIVTFNNNLKEDVDIQVVEDLGNGVVGWRGKFNHLRQGMATKV